MTENDPSSLMIAKKEATDPLRSASATSDMKSWTASRAWLRRVEEEGWSLIITRWEG